MLLLALSLIPCLIGLWLGTKWIMRAAFGISAKFGLSHAFVGIAILAVGSDLPEVFVSVKAALLHLRGIEASGIITGNAIGSSITQITIVLGVAALLMNATVPRESIRRDAVALTFGIILLLFFSLDGFVSRFEGAVLLLVYVIYYFILIKTEKLTEEVTESEESFWKLSLYMLAGLAVLIVSSHFLVEHTMVLAEFAGLQQSFAGIFIVGVGTSLPELAISIAAARNKSAGMSVGNIIGSNIFDGLVPIGLGGSISTATVEKGILTFDIPFLSAATLIALLFLYKNSGTSRIMGATLIILFLSYMLLKIYSA